MLTRSAVSLSSWLASRLEERHEWIAARAVALDLRPEGGREDRERWLGEAVTAFAAALKMAPPALPDRFRADPAGAAQPMLVLQAQALLAVLGADGHPDPRELPFAQLAEDLMKHERRRWRATAATWEWGSGGTLPEALQERSIAAFALLGSTSDAEAEQILGRVPELRDADAERLSAIASWISALYPPGPSGAPRIRPDMIGEWFVVSQLTAHPALAQSLRNGLTEAQAARALGFLARAADRMESASHLFDELGAALLKVGQFGRGWLCRLGLGLLVAAVVVA